MKLFSHRRQEGEYEKSLEYTLCVLELKADMYQSMGTVSMVYKIQGDIENSEKYCKLYAVNGESAKVLRAALDEI